MEKFFSAVPIESWTLPILVFVFSTLVGIIIDRQLQRKLRPQDGQSDPESLSHIAAKTLHYMPILWSLIIGIYWAIHMIDITPYVQNILSLFLKSLVLLSTTITVARIIVNAVHYYLRRNAENLSSSSLLAHLLEFIVYSCGLMIILQACDISIAPILTALGIGGMAVAIALQDTLTNFFAGLQLIVMKPIKVGDFIRLSTGEEGFVVDINFRHTSIQDVNLGMIIVPNQAVSSATLMNYDLPRREIFLTIPCGVSYDSDLEHVERVCIEVATAVMEQQSPNTTYEPFVRFQAFGPSSIDFNVILPTDNVAQRSILRHEFVKALTVRFREEGIEIPYPIQTVQLTKQAE